MLLVGYGLTRFPKQFLSINSIAPFGTVVNQNIRVIAPDLYGSARTYNCPDIAGHARVLC